MSYSPKMQCMHCPERARLADEVDRLRAENERLRPLLARWLAWGAADSGVIDTALFTDTDGALPEYRHPCAPGG